MDLCEKYKVAMTESMAERLTELLPEKEADTDGLRVDILRRIAELCVSQQEYHLATKKYTQAGMKDKAMDALLKSGDTEKIIYFASVLRSKEIWIRAANYLQVAAALPSSFASASPLSLSGRGALVDACRMPRSRVAWHTCC